MNFVYPIRDPALVEDIAAYLKKNNDRDYMMFLLGIYTGRRISDILKLRVKDLKGKNYMTIREKKTGKQATVKINPILKRELQEYCKDKEDDEYIIKSRQRCNRPLDRSSAYKMLRNVAKKFDLENVGTHTLRKTFGYHFYKQTKDVVTLMQIFNHSHPSVTLRYIGINEETANQAIDKFKIF